MSEENKDINPDAVFEVPEPDTTLINMAQELRIMSTRRQEASQLTDSSDPWNERANTVSEQQPAKTISQAVNKEAAIAAIANNTIANAAEQTVVQTANEPSASDSEDDLSDPFEVKWTDIPSFSSTNGNAPLPSQNIPQSSVQAAGNTAQTQAVQAALPASVLPKVSKQQQPRNRRLVFIGGGALIAVALYLLSNYSSSESKAAPAPVKKQQAPATVMSPPQTVKLDSMPNSNSVMTTSDFNAADDRNASNMSAYNTNNDGAKKKVITRTDGYYEENNSSSSNAPIRNDRTARSNVSQANQSPAVVTNQYQPRPFVFSLNETARVSLQEEKGKEPPKEVKKSTPLAGLKVPMRLIEPFRTGIRTQVKAQVTADVRDIQGNVIVPANSIATITFIPFEVNGRCLNDPEVPTIILTPDGNNLALRGQVKGMDGFAGVGGKVKKFNNGSFLGRIGRGVAGIAGRAAGGATGGAATGVVEETVNEGVSAPNVISSSDRVVEITSGTGFTLHVR